MESCQQIAMAREAGNDEKLGVVYRRFYDDIDLLDTKEAQAIYSGFFEKGGNNER